MSGGAGDGDGDGGSIPASSGGAPGGSGNEDDLSALVPVPPLYPNCEIRHDETLPFPGRLGAARVVDALWNEASPPDLPGDPDAIATYGDLVEYALMVLDDPRVEGGIGDFALRLLDHSPNSGFQSYMGAALPAAATDALYDSLVASVREFGVHILREDSPSTLSYLLTTDEGYVDESLATFHDISWESGDPSWQSLPHRSGLFTHPYFAVRTSWWPYTSAPTRGTRLQERLFCMNIPLLPDALPSDLFSDWGEEESARDYWGRTVLSIPNCAPCHEVITPLGLGLEQYDAIGRFRELEGEHPIDTTTRFSHPDLGEARFSHPSRFFAYFATHPQTQTCITTQLLEIVLGKPIWGSALPDTRLTADRIRRLASCAIDSGSTPDLDLRLLIAHIVASVDFQLTFPCGDLRCSRDIEICTFDYQDGMIRNAACLASSPPACPDVDELCSCSQQSDEVTVACIQE